MHDPRLIKDFERQWAKHLVKLNRFARQFTTNRDEADDILQESRLLALENFDELKNPTAFSSWVWRIIYSRAMDLKRKPVIARLAAEHDIPVADPGTTSVILRDEADRLIKKARQILTSGEYEVFMLCVVEDCSYDEAAEIIQKPLGTVKSRLFSARARLKDSLLLVA